MKKISTLYITLCLLWIALFKIYLIPKNLQQMIKIIAILIITLFIIKNIKSKKNLINRKILFWCFIIIISSIWGNIKGYIVFDNVLNSILHAICIYYIFVLIEYSKEHNKIDEVLKSLIFILTIYNSISILTIIAFGYNTEAAIIYFLGDKFRTSYYFIMLCAVIICLYNKKIQKNLILKFFYFILIVGVIFICSYMKCSTTVIGATAFLILYIIPKKYKNILCKKETILIILVLSAIIIFGFNYVLSFDIVRYIIVNVLHENINLTGRMHIYSFLIEVLKQSLIIGHGYGNYAVGNASGFGNAQNAIFQILIDYGVIGLLIFLKFFYECIKNNNVNSKNWGMYMYLIISLICSSVEISFNYLFYISLIFIYVCDYKELKQEEKINE